MNDKLNPNERIDDLQRNGLKIIQNTQAFRFGMDAVLLADFMRIRPHEHVADMGTGTGILPLLLSQKNETCIFEAFEIQPEMAQMAQRSVCLNGLEERIHVHAADMRSAWKIVGRERMHAVVCNPPYGKRGGTLTSGTESVSLARHEADCTIEDVAASCAAVLRNHGRLCIVFPAQRMLELCDALRQNRLEPKRIRMVCAHADKPPYLVMVEAMKNARPQLLWMPPLVVYHSDGSETDEIRRIYHQA
ncbi:MAG: tRNA1(Val) (adenine(37)-N6)-methyltransferase [Clostridia bacterium]|nr:tRNA1(Val) (adenine(37)-N6)-methyltransferase [Clostridia bacterium]MDD6040453.1 tRNA1(Val) (adenine(37)-N6)-methyltransferase [Clostridia bacterium]